MLLIAAIQCRGNRCRICVMCDLMYIGFISTVCLNLRITDFVPSLRWCLVRHQANLNVRQTNKIKAPDTKLFVSCNLSSPVWFAFYYSQISFIVMTVNTLVTGKVLTSPSFLEAETQPLSTFIHGKYTTVVWGVCVIKTSCSHYKNACLINHGVLRKKLWSRKKETEEWT